MSFSYIIDKIKKAPTITEPFAHLQINDLFTESHFKVITESQDVTLTPQANDSKLFDELFAAGYKIIDFPGCITDKNAYVAWHKERKADGRTNTACEGFGVTLRLMKPRSTIIAELMEFLNGKEFQASLLEKFDIDEKSVYYDAGIQKYLDGYEISPHPDIRKKALTYMVNVNANPNSHREEHHTHYLTFKPKYKYVQAFWEENLNRDRCWVPWDWCETQKIQRENNSMVIFAPSNNTMHGVKARYNHMVHQRTQLYGNLWFRESITNGTPAWEDFVVNNQVIPEPVLTLKERVSELLPQNLKNALKKGLGIQAPTNVISDRLGDLRDSKAE